jgi:hypothetical protein
MDFTVTGSNGKIEYDLNGNLLSMLQKGGSARRCGTGNDRRYYYQSAVTHGTGNNLSSNVITSLIQLILGSSSASGLAKSNTANINSALSVDPNFLNATNPGVGNSTGTNPKAYLSIIFFDERFNFVSEGSTVLRVTAAGDNAAPLVLPNMRSPKTGYAYIYVSNESNEPREQATARANDLNDANDNVQNFTIGYPDANTAGSGSTGIFTPFNGIE